jgi:hypothetical protein
MAQQLGMVVIVIQQIQGDLSIGRKKLRASVAPEIGTINGLLPEQPAPLGNSEYETAIPGEGYRHMPVPEIAVIGLTLKQRVDMLGTHGHAFEVGVRATRPQSPGHFGSRLERVAEVAQQVEPIRSLAVLVEEAQRANGRVHVKYVAPGNEVRILDEPDIAGKGLSPKGAALELVMDGNGGAAEQGA